MDHSETFLLSELFSVSPSSLWVNLGFKLSWTGLGLGLGGSGTKGFGVPRGSGTKEFGVGD